VITRQLLDGKELWGLDSKLSGIAFGMFVPFFFIASGMTVDIGAFASAGGILRTVLFLMLMLLARGTAALLLSRRDLDASSRRALALMSSTQLPLVIAITALGTAAGRMSPSIAADLVGAAVLSTITLPLLALRMRRRRRNSATPTPVPVAELSPA
jgi:Kef-type K+ transport system membrane component KefB